MTQTIYRANNPCAVRPLGRGKWNGETGIVRVGGGEFSAFRTMAYGVRAGLRVLDTYRTKHRLYSARQIITRWAPPSDSNPTTSYARFVAARCGVGVDDPIPFDYRHTRLLIEAIIAFELAKGLSVRPADIDEAFRMMAAEEAAEIGGYPAPYVRNMLDVFRRQPKQRPRATGWIEGIIATIVTAVSAIFSGLADMLWSIGVYPRDALAWASDAFQGIQPMWFAAFIAGLAIMIVVWLIFTRKDAPHAETRDTLVFDPKSNFDDEPSMPDGAIGIPRVGGDAGGAVGLQHRNGPLANGGGGIRWERDVDGGSGGGSLFDRFPAISAISAISAGNEG